MALGLRGYVNLLAFVVVGSTGLVSVGHAHEAAVVEVCERALYRPLTLNHAREAAARRNDDVRSFTAPVEFFDIAAQARVEQIADSRTPASIRDVLGRNVGVVATPTPTSPDEVTVGLVEERKSFVAHVSTEWAGRARTTAAYVSLAGAKIRSAGDYLIGPENETVLFHLHGGGTPTATGKNGVSIGEKMVARGFATVGIDLPGHGIATKNIVGLETTEQQVDYILKVIDQLVHPAVKIVVSGHSWGGQFAAYMHRHSSEPKYARIAEFISLSPPVDVSNCGDPRGKARFDEDWHERLPEFADRIAATDTDFLNNLLKHGKDSEIGRIFCSATDTQYATPRLSVEEQAKLKPITVVVGKADGLVYVGRERQFDEAWGNLVAPSAYIELGPGETFDGKRDTGHNIFDLLDGQKRYLVYNLIGDVLARVAKTPSPWWVKGAPPLLTGIHQNFPNLETARVSDKIPPGVRTRLDKLRAYVRDFDRISALPKEERKLAEAPINRAYGELMALDQVAMHYANFIGFRTALNDEYQNVEINSPDLTRLAALKVSLDNYERDVAKLREETKRTTLRAERAAIETLAKNLGLHPNLDPARAAEELHFAPKTPERSAALQKFIADAEAVDAEIAAAGHPEFDRAIEMLSAKYADTLHALNVTMTTYDQARQKFSTPKGLSKVENQQRIELTNLHQDVLSAVKARDARAIALRAERMAAASAAIGINDPRQARRELDADLSDARKAALRKFVDQYPVLIREARDAEDAKLNVKIAAVARPAGVDADAKVADLKVALDELMKFAHAPVGSGLQDLVAQMVAKRVERDEALKGRAGEPTLDVLAKATDQLRLDRADAIGRWNALWSQNLFSSPQVDDDAHRLVTSEADYKTRYYAYLGYAAARDLDLQLAGEWNVDAIHNPPADLRDKFNAYLKARREIDRERRQVETTRVEEALAGNLEPLPNLSANDTHAATVQVLEAVSLAKQIWGPSVIHAPQEPNESLSVLLSRNEKILEERRRRLSVFNKELDEMRAEYVERMRDIGEAVPYDVARIRLRDVINHDLGLGDVLDRMDREPHLYLALDQTVRGWDELMKQLRSAHNRSKDTGGY